MGGEGVSGAGGRRWVAGLGLFGEVVVVGVLVLPLALPLVTALPALAAGTAHLRRYVAGERARVVDALREFVTACRRLWQPALGAAGAALLLVWNLSLGQAGVVPGAGGVVAVSLLLLAALAVLLLRTAAAWRPATGDDGPRLVWQAAELSWRDPVGSLLLAGACVVCGVFVWMLVPLVVVVGGLLSLANLAVAVRAGAVDVEP